MNLILFLAFILYTTVVVLMPSGWELRVIESIQNSLKDLPLIIPLLPDCFLYIIMIAIPIISLCVYFIKNKKWIDFGFAALIPIVTFLLNCIIKPLIHRARPPYELQIGNAHPDSFSYVSSHSLVMFSLWTIVIYYAYKYNLPYKSIITTIAVLWIIFVGFSRIWLGVHYPTDVIGAYILGCVIISTFITIRKSL